MEPNWSEAPEWARWVATDLLGYVWFEDEPEWRDFIGWQRTSGRSECHDGCYGRRIQARVQ